MGTEIKLSEKQKEVIRLLQSGWEMYAKYYTVVGTRGQTVYASMKYWIQDIKDTDAKRVHHSTFLGLYEKGLIQNVRPYELTELGKSIEL